MNDMIERSEYEESKISAQVPAPKRPESQPSEDWLLGFIERVKKRIGWLWNLSILGVIGTAIATFLQYKAAENEQNLARYKEDFAAATTAFSDVTMSLQAATRLQSALFTNFSEAVKAKTSCFSSA